MLPPPETITAIATLVGIGAAAISAFIVLRFQHFDKEMKALKEQVVSKSNQVDIRLDAEIMKAPNHDKKVIKKLVSQISSYESTITAIEEMRSRMTGNFKFDLVSYALLGIILLMGLSIEPIEVASVPMFVVAMLVILHITNFGSTVFSYLKVRKAIEDEEESERKKD